MAFIPPVPLHPCLAKRDGAGLSEDLCLLTFPLMECSVNSLNMNLSDLFSSSNRQVLFSTQTETSLWYKTAAAQKINLISRLNPKKKTVTAVQTWRWAPACVKTPFSGGENSPVQSLQADLYFSPFLCQQTWRNLHPDLSKSQFSRAPRYRNPSASTRGCVDVGGNLRVSPRSTLLRKFKIPCCCGWGLEDLLQAN